MTCCCVIGCPEIGTHRFPKDLELLKQWLNAIRRKDFVPKVGTRLCRNHFVESDYTKQGKYSGLDLQLKCLRKGAVPSIFPWTIKTEDTTATGAGSQNMGDDTAAEVKDELVDVEIDLSQSDEHNLHGLCSVCLCMSEDTHKTNDEALKSYMDIVSETQLPCLVSPRICWECSPLLQRASRFREQVKRSHIILHSILEASDREDISERVRKVSRPPRLQITDCGSFEIPGCVETADEDDEDYDEDMPDPIYVETEYLASETEMDAAVDRDQHTSQDNTKDTEEPNHKPLERNLPLDNVDRPFKCNMCQKTYSRNDSLKRHMTAHTGEVKSTKRQCKVCMKRFSHLKRHMKTHAGASVKCDQKMPQETTRDTEETKEKSPETQPVEEKPTSYQLSLKCDSCEFYTVSKPALERHLHLHDEKRPFQCNICQKNFTRNDALKRHMATHPGAESLDVKRQCKVCKKIFSRRSYLKSHMRTHTGEKPFTCVICQSSCSSSAILKIHMRIHTGEKPYKCTVCEKEYSSTSELKRHMVACHHGTEKPFKCTLCQKGYQSSCSLKEHMITHAAKMPFECAVCHKGFSRSCNMNAHMLSHSGEKPYKCAICQKGYTRRDNVVKHIEAAHPK